MLFRYRSYCLDCRHQWDWVRSRIECGHIHFQKSETNRWYFCQRCFLDLFVPRRLNRSTWLRWVSENASELSRSPLMFKACELGVVVDRQSLEVIARSPLLFRACEIVASILAGSRSSYVPASIEIGTMECPGCGDRMAIGRSGLRARHQPGKAELLWLCRSGPEPRKVIESSHDRIGIVDAPAPCAAADRL